MAKRTKPPKWQEGSLETEITLPADKTKSGNEETVPLRLRWKVVRGRRRTARDWTRWEIDQARELLDRVAHVADRLDDGEELPYRQVEDLDTAKAHAVRAWCRTHLRCKDASSSNDSYFEAFHEKAPEGLRHALTRVGAAFFEHRKGTERMPASAVVETVQGAVEALLEAASRPPRNRRRFPAHLRTGRPPRKPRVQPGSWIQTGRYRPAVVLEMLPDPPHTMKLSYGDEVDEDFRPHIDSWASIRKHKRLPSLKDVYSPGDWIRNRYSGYGRLLAVRDSTMDVECRGRFATIVPGRDLSRWQKVDDPGPQDSRPVGERAAPGTWIDMASFGEGVVLAVEGDVLTVLFHDGFSGISRVRQVTEPGNGDASPVIWTLERAPVDLQSPWGQRWAWWWLQEAVHRTQINDLISLRFRPVCACCGYPNLGRGPRNEFVPTECLICGYPDFGTAFENDDVPRVLRARGLWWYRNARGAPLPDGREAVSGARSTEGEWDTSGYSIFAARRNYESHGTMFRPGDKDRESTEALADLRRSLVRLLDRAMAEPTRWEDQKAVEQFRLAILKELESKNTAPGDSRPT